MSRVREEKVRQHTVPRRYLKGFTCGGDKLIQYDRNTGKPCPVNIDNASVVKRIYSIQRSNGEWDDSIEDYFMKLENSSGPILDKMIEGQVPTREEKRIFALYLARQMQRGHLVANFAQEEAAKFRDRDFVLNVVEVHRKKLESKHGRENLERALQDFEATDQGVVVDPKTYLKFIVPQTPSFAAIIADAHWRLEKGACKESCVS